MERTLDPLPGRRSHGTFVALTAMGSDRSATFEDVDTEKTLVTFSSRAFNCTEPRGYFINPCCFGDDLATWFAARLRSRGCEVMGEPGQEDFGCCLDFRAGDAEHTLVIGYRPGADDLDDAWRPVENAGVRGAGDWLVWIKRKRGLLGFLSGRRRTCVKPEAILAVHETLTAAPEVANVTWHRQREFDRGDERGSPRPW